MQFRGSTTSTDASYRQGIVEEIDRLCDSDDTSYPRADKTSRVNNFFEKVVGWLINADGIWEFDDSRYTSLPIGTYTLVNAQRSYTFAADFLQLLEVSVMDSNGVYIKIPQFDPFVEPVSVEEFWGTASGFPEVFDLVSDDTIKFYPNISSSFVTLTAGLQVKFKRTARLFTVTTGTGEDTAEPGFASPWHSILAYGGARPYCALYKKDIVPWLNSVIGDTTEISTGMKKELLAHYSRRNKEHRAIMTHKSSPFI